jgi:hypothetical protein
LVGVALGEGVAVTMTTRAVGELVKVEDTSA